MCLNEGKAADPLGDGDHIADGKPAVVVHVAHAGDGQL